MHTDVEERMALREFQAPENPFRSLPSQVTLQPGGGIHVAGSRADKIIKDVSATVADINDPRDRLARQVGILQSYVRSLCAECDDLVDELTNKGEA
jgi:hypothetical protein